MSEILVTMRLVDMPGDHPAQDTSRVCGKCFERVGLSPSLREVLAAYPGIEIRCQICALSDAVKSDKVQLAGGLLENVRREMAQFIRRRRNQPWDAPMSHQLICMRLAQMVRRHPAQDNSKRCSRCRQRVGIYPSGCAALKADPTIAILCNICFENETFDVFVPAAETREDHEREMSESYEHLKPKDVQ